MLKLCLLISVFCTPLLAVAPEAGAALALEAATIEITIAPKGDAVAVTITHSLIIRNTGAAADFELTLADTLVPEKLHETFKLTVGGADATPNHNDGRFAWTIHVDGLTTLAWTTTAGATRLPHVHALGRLELTVQLAHLRSYESLPGRITIHVNHDGLPGELFGRDSDAAFTVQHPAGTRVQDFSVSWAGSTLKDKRAELAATLDGFEEKSTADNRLYTTTLAHAVDLALLASDHETVAEHCEVLARLEAEAGHAITECGPWAQWRRYVPWQMLRLQALEALGRNSDDCARSAVAVMADRWPAYLKAKAATRPFDAYAADKFGSYWDYDWATTRKLYARALEISGDAEAAAAVDRLED